MISLNTKAVERYLSDNSLPAPSTEAHGPSETVLADDKEAAARCTAIGAMQELKCLMLGPTSTLMSVGAGASNFNEDILSRRAMRSVTVPTLKVFNGGSSASLPVQQN